MSVLLTGSIANDYLMVFPGRFREQLVDDQLDNVSLSFLVDGLDIYRGGTGANIAFGLGQLGLRPVLVGAVGSDFGDYRSWLEANNVDTSHVRVSKHLHTARFICTTDADHNQIASFYAGAMTEAADIDLAKILPRAEGVWMAVICPDNPAAMIRHTRVCRDRSLTFAADPSQQLARMDGDDIRELVNGASFLFTNEYERDLLTQKTGWSQREVLDRVGAWVTTLGPNGATIERSDGFAVVVPAAPELRKVDPTGVGDAFRSGFLAGLTWRLDLERAGQLGCALASLVIETAGTQEYTFAPDAFLERFAAAYGEAAGAEIEPFLSPAPTQVPAI
ncbi:carbohydrate kinase family protein [Streptomyces sp. NPDC005708]|uniref:carbohydrate kinase family protein n=1 Tax=Streptomyces sp. NPDC005708 TaxID=3154564 RepID=UPI0033C96CC6